MKILLITFISCLSFSSFAEESPAVRLHNRDSLIHFAEQFIGTPYKYGGSSTAGFDCSGFVHYVFKHFNIGVSRTSIGFQGQGTEREMQEAVIGDVILFTGTNSSVRQIGHVGIIYKNDNGVIDFIHSSSSKNHWGVTITRLNESGYTKRFMGVIDLLK
jgi:cell wall-associated NlpC family hydrolase